MLEIYNLALPYVFIFAALDLFYVFFNGAHFHVLRFPLKIYLPGQNGQKQLKIAFFTHFQFFCGFSQKRL